MVNNYFMLPTNEISKRINELDIILMGDCTTKAWDKAYKERNELSYVLDERYREKYQDQFNAYYAEHIEGKRWEDIDPAHWEFYSDWHKDMYGFRPHII